MLPKSAPGGKRRNDRRFSLPPAPAFLTLTFPFPGQIPKWPTGEDCKSSGFAFTGSNPVLPTLSLFVTSLVRAGLLKRIVLYSNQLREALDGTFRVRRGRVVTRPEQSL
jgi:hypothetical protein